MSILSIPNTIEAGQPIRATPLRENFTAVQTWANGNITADNIGDLSVTSAKLAPLSVTNAKLAGSITPDKLASSIAVYTTGPESSEALTISVASTYVDVPDTTIDAFTPAVDSILLCSGYVMVATGDGTTPRTLVSVSNGSTSLVAVQQVISTVSVNARTLIPLTFPIELDALTTYNLKIRASMSVTGTLTVHAARLSGLLVPR